MLRFSYWYSYHVSLILYCTYAEIRIEALALSRVEMTSKAISHLNIPSGIYTQPPAYPSHKPIHGTVLKMAAIFTRTLGCPFRQEGVAPCPFKPDVGKKPDWVMCTKLSLDWEGRLHSITFV